MTATRMPAIWTAVVGYVTALVAYLLVWGDGVPLVGARSPFEQFVTAQTTLLLVVLPWVAARCLAVGSRDGVATLALLGGQRPLAVVLGTYFGLVAVLATVVAAGLPMAVLAQQTSTYSSWEVATAQARLVGLAACVAPISVAATLMSENRVWGWVLGVVASAILATATPGGLAGGVILPALGAFAAAALASHAERRWKYCAELA